MVSLTDIVPQTRTVPLADGELVLRGLGLRQIADLFLAFPSLRNVFTEGAPDVAIAELVVQAPDAIATIIAEAAGQPEAADGIAGGALTPDEVLDCLAAIRDLTAPRGLLPLFQKAMAFLGGGEGAAPPRKDRVTNAPRPRSNSSPPATIAAE